MLVVEEISGRLNDPRATINHSRLYTPIRRFLIVTRRDISPFLGFLDIIFFSPFIFLPSYTRLSRLRETSPAGTSAERSFDRSDPSISRDVGKGVSRPA